MRVETSEQALAVVKEVCRQFPSIKLALIYGSASRNELRPHSDLDVAVSSGSKMPWEVRGKLFCLLIRRRRNP